MAKAWLNKALELGEVKKGIDWVRFFFDGNRWCDVRPPKALCAMRGRCARRDAKTLLPVRAAAGCCTLRCFAAPAHTCGCICWPCL